jgi:predicted nucleic acid-binding protein
MDSSRLIRIYAPSSEYKDRYLKLAKEKRVTLSRFLISAIESALDDEKSTVGKHPGEIAEELSELREELERTRLLLNRYEKELHKLRDLEWTKDDLQGLLTHDQRLIDALKNKGPIHDSQLLEALGIDMRDIDQVKIISRQLGDLEGFGLIAKGSRGWKWLG